ncbi:hypothetical protein PJL18_01755 [Paenarthrobacter nicotinovorans]|nr:hypothetical protein [Paenarthrobacter nicotinovorans]
MPGVVEDVVHRPGLDALAAVHDQHVVADLGHYAEVVRDEDQRRVRFLLEL